MQIQYVSSVVYPEDFAELFPDRSKMPGQQAQKYHRLLIEGISQNEVPVHAISSVPITPRNYPHKWYAGKKHRIGNVEYRYLPVLNVAGLKILMQFLGAFFAIAFLPNKKEQAVVCDVLNASVSRGAVLAAKLFKMPCVGIVTDLPDMMVTGGSKKYTDLVNSNIADCTHYVLLTEQMNEVVNTQHKPYTIIEGLCDMAMGRVDTDAIRRKEKTCMYAGLLDVRYGVKNMVEAFLQAAVPESVMHIYGAGPYAEELTAVAKQNDNVVFHGSVLNEEVVQAEQQVSLLINPRPTTEEFTKYSFPSKNMEYMASGTAVLTTKLPGMPKEYHDKVFLFTDESISGMAETFREVFGLSEAVLSNKGKKAKNFVLENKNAVVQSRNLLNLVGGFQQIAGK